MAEIQYDYTEGQKVLHEKLTKFLNGQGKIFRITGKPGVGKTFMIGQVLKSYIDADNQNTNSKPPNVNVVGITLSHRAKKVLGEQIPYVYTFAAAYGLKEVIDEKTGERHFEHNRYADKKQLVGDMDIKIFVHDEISQYTQDMIDIVQHRTSIFSKIILMGDKAQLPPIDTNPNRKSDLDSPIFDIQVDDEYELTERVRQAKGNPILDLTDAIREEIFGSQNLQRILYIMSQDNISDDMGYKCISPIDLKDHFKSQDLLNTTIVAYRNATVSNYNFTLRNYILKNAKDIIIDDDIICMTDNYIELDDMGYPKFYLHNSDVFKLSKVFKYKHKVFCAGVRYEIECYQGDTDELGRKKFRCPTEEGKIAYEIALKQVAEKCKSFKYKWSEFWSLKDEFCKYDYGYSMTVYKVQGSTYDCIYIDVNDVLQTGPLSPKRKLQTIYTAITRAKKMAYLLTD